MLFVGGLFFGAGNFSTVSAKWWGWSYNSATRAENVRAALLAKEKAEAAAANAKVAEQATVVKAQTEVAKVESQPAAVTKQPEPTMSETQKELEATKLIVKRAREADKSLSAEARAARINSKDFVGDARVDKLKETKVRVDEIKTQEAQQYAGAPEHNMLKGLGDTKDTVSDKILQAWSDVVSSVKDWSSQKKTVTLNIASIARANGQRHDAADYFVDIDDSASRQAIMTLKEKDIVKGYGDKFFPKNHVRSYAFLKTLVNAYRTQADFDLDTMAWLTDNEYIEDLGFDSETNKAIQTAYEMWILDKSEIDFNEVLDYGDLKVIFENFAKQYPDIVNEQVAEKLYASDNVVTNESMANLLVDFFEIQSDEAEKEWYVFRDTSFHEFGSAVESLAELDVIDSNAKEFAIDASASREDLIVMLSNALSEMRSESLDDYDLSMSDVSDANSNDHHIAYAVENGIADFLLESKRGETYLHPEKELTKYEALKIISEQANVDFAYDENEADSEVITKGELAEMVYESFDFKKPYKYQSEDSDSNSTITVDLGKWKQLFGKVKGFFNSLLSA